MEQKTLVKAGLSVVALLFFAYLGAAVVVANRELTRHRVWRDKLLALKVNIDREVPTLKTAEPLAPLSEACEGKLAPKGFKAIVGYVDQGDLPPSETLVGELMGYVADGDRFSYDFMAHAEAAPEFGLKLVDALDPWTWDRRDSHTDPAVASYLVITVPLKIEFPALSPDDKSFTTGKADVRSRVVALPDGKVVCEGTSEPEIPQKLELNGRGRTDAEARARAENDASWRLHYRFTNAIQYVPLLEVCAGADERYCGWVRGQLH